MSTVKELTDQAISAVWEANRMYQPYDYRDLQLAVDALEDAQMRFTRGLAKAQDRFSPADLQAVPS